jgi:hypothetical protein
VLQLRFPGVDQNGALTSKGNYRVREFEPERTAVCGQSRRSDGRDGGGGAWPIHFAALGRFTPRPLKALGNRLQLTTCWKLSELRLHSRTKTRKVDNCILLLGEGSPMQADSRTAGEHFEVELLGRMIRCASLDDATAVKSAHDILVGNDPTPYSMVQLKPLAQVLARYGQQWAAERLTNSVR